MLLFTGYLDSITPNTPCMWRIYEQNKPKKMTEKETTIYLLKFALEVIEGEGLERSTNRDNWVIGRDIEEHLETLQKENKTNDINSVSGTYSKEDMEKSFDKGGDWRIACKNLTDGKISKIEWSENYEDFEEFISNYR